MTKQFESRKRIMTYPTLELAAWSLSILRDRHEILGMKEPGML
jgi:hypothetical protein